MVPVFLLGLDVICNLKRDYQTLLATPFALLGLLNFLTLSGNGRYNVQSALDHDSLKIRTHKDKGHIEIVPYGVTEEAELRETD